MGEENTLAQLAQLLSGVLKPPSPAPSFVNPAFREERPPDALQLMMEALKGAFGVGGQQPIGSNLDRAQAGGEMLSMAGVPIAAAKKGIRAFHGSPHDFDQFSLSKIGTGEGAQAYGHGLYFAENPEVAHGYRTKLSDSAIDTVKADVYDIAGERMWKLKATGPNGTVPVSNQYLRDSELEQWLGQPAAEKLIKGGDGTYKNLNIRPGKTYEVNINADPADFLDWDAPLSQQPKILGKLSAEDKSRRYMELQDALEQIQKSGKLDTPEWNAAVAESRQLRESAGGIAPTMPGSEAYRNLTNSQFMRPIERHPNNVGALQERATDALKAKGIPGIKYLDGASRGKEEGSRNYVVFDEKLIEIVKKYGIAAAVSAGLLSESQARQMQEQGYH